MTNETNKQPAVVLFATSTDLNFMQSCKKCMEEQGYPSQWLAGGRHTLIKVCKKSEVSTKCRQTHGLVVVA